MSTTHNLLLRESRLAASLAQGAVLLTANRRLARAFSADYSLQQIEQGKLAWETPNILPIDAWWQSLYEEFRAIGLLPYTLLSQDQEQLLWNESISASDTNGVYLSVNATASAAMKAWHAMHAYAVKDTDDQYLTLDQHAFKRWTTHYKLRCEQLNFIDRARLPDVLIALCDRDAEAAKRMPAAVWLSGFLQMTPQIEQFCALCRRLGASVDIVKQFVEQESTRVRTACADRPAELRSAAQWAQRQLTQQLTTSASQPRLAIVVSDLHLQRTQVQRCFDQVFFPAATPDQIRQQIRPYELSLGLPLAQFAPVKSALAVLALGLDCLRGPLISEFILSPYLTGGDTESGARAELDASLRMRGYQKMQLHQLTDVTETPARMRAFLQKMLAVQTAAHSLPSVWYKRIISLLRAAGWPGPGKLHSEEFQAIDAWQNCLDDIQRLDDVLGECSASRINGVVGAISRARVFQAQSTTAPIQIMGSYEAVGLQFDAAWYTGFDNECWPPVQRATPFLSRQAQKRAGVPGASLEEDLAIANRLLELFASSARQTIFSYCTTSHDNEVYPAEQIKTFPAVELQTLVGDCNVNVIEAVHQSIQLESLSDYNGPALESHASVKGGARLFEDQAECPFRAFALHRLRVRALEDVSAGLTPRDKGNLLHETMARFWSETRSHDELLALSDASLEQRIDSCIAGAIDQLLPVSERRRRAALLDIEKNRLHRIVASWLKYYEKPRAPFSVEQIEEEIKVDFEDLKLTLKLDRMDKLQSGGHAIIDYKTGKTNSVSSWKEERISRAQLPLYAVIMQDIKAICFAQVAVNKQRFVGMAEQRGLIAQLLGPENESDSWPDRLNFWHDNLAHIASEVKQGRATVTPAKNACQFCELAALCRINTVTAEVTHTNSDEAESSLQ